MKKAIIIIITNTSPVFEHTAKLFGYKKNHLKPNYGSPHDLRINSGIPDLSYTEIIAMCESQPLSACSIEVFASEAQRCLPISTVDVKADSNGATTITPKYGEQISSQCSKIEGEFILDGEKDVTLVILPSTTVVLRFEIKK